MNELGHRAKGMHGAKLCWKWNGLNLKEILIKIAELDFCLVLDGAQLNLSSFKNRMYVSCSHSLQYCM